MHARNLPLFQSSDGFPAPAHDDDVTAPASRRPHEVIETLRAIGQRNLVLFWLQVAALALGVGVFTWFVF